MITAIITKIRRELMTTFFSIDRWLEADVQLMDFQPLDRGWDIRLILEHISITNHYLLILINKGTRRALEKARQAEFENLVDNYEFPWAKLEEVGRKESFAWHRPDHMEPRGQVSLRQIRTRLHIQLQECLDCLEQMPNGEGIFYKTMMSVNDIGRIDVYQYIYFLVQHAKRHLAQLENIKQEFEKNAVTKNLGLPGAKRSYRVRQCEY